MKSSHTFIIEKPDSSETASNLQASLESRAQSRAEQREQHIAKPKQTTDSRQQTAKHGAQIG